MGLRPASGRRKSTRAKNGVRMQRILALVLALLASLPASASSYFVIEVRAPSLNIRSSPGTTGKAIGMLKRGDKVIAGFSGVPGWFLVVAGNYERMGFVAANHVRVLQVFSPAGDDSAETECGADGAQVSLRIDDVDFSCSESVMGGFDSCEAEFSFSVTSDCEEDLYVTVECDAEFGYQTRDLDFERSDEEDESGSLYVSGGHGSDTITVEWSSSMNIVDPVLRARLKDGSCRISGVSD